MSVSGCLFDLAKLNDISKNVISVMTADEVYERTLEWAKEYDDEYYAVLSENESKAKLMMDLDRGGKKPRKDIAKWSEVKNYFSYFYPMYYKKTIRCPKTSLPRTPKKFSPSI